MANIRYEQKRMKTVEFKENRLERIKKRNK